MNFKKTIFLFFFFLLSSPVSWSQPDVSNDIKPSKIKLATPYKTLSKQTKKIPIGLWITLDKGWHSYWQYPGDSGKPVKVQWILPEGSLISHLNWPIPERMYFGALTNFVYKNHFLLTSELSLPEKNAQPHIKIIAQVEWFICKEVCIPMNQEVQLDLRIKQKEEINPYWKSIFDKWSKQMPKIIKQKIILQSKKDHWQAHIATKKKLQVLDVFPFSKDTFSSQKPTILSTNDYQHFFLIKKQAQRRQNQFQGLGSLPANIAIYSKSALRKNFPALVVLKSENDKLGFIYTFTQKKDSMLWFLLLAFLGGLILNFMPCVLPIVFLKFSNTLEQSKQKKSEIILSNLFYSVGVIFSFMLLAFILLLLKIGGESIGWGFQMQSPYFLLIMIFLFVLISFNFMGWFSPSLPSFPFFHRGKNYLKHFLTGILSTTAASPCTVPFMGAAIGYAFLGSLFQTVIIFFFLGLGLSFPYLLLSVFPKWIQYVPIPGEWSNKLKLFMAFPMLASSIWLIDLFNRQKPNTLFPLLLSLLFLAFGFWLLQNIKKRAWLTWLSRAIILTSLIYPFLSLFQETKSNIPGIPWETFSLDKMEKIQSEGQALFVNFTADWCLTCKFNKQVTFKNKKVIQFFTDQKIRSLKGDWTNKNPEISDVLKSYNRSGIPFYLYFPPAPGSLKSSAIILPELLTPGLFFKYVNSK